MYMQYDAWMDNPWDCRLFPDDDIELECVNEPEEEEAYDEVRWDI